MNRQRWLPRGDYRKVLSEIADWKLDAKLEDIGRYFYSVSAAQPVVSGGRSFLSGRKGSGKTAVAQHILAMSDYNVFSEKLSFQNAPFGQLYEMRDTRYHLSAQYITIWKYLIYSSLLTMMYRNAAVNASIPEDLKRIATSSQSGLGQRLLDRLSQIKLMILGSGVDLQMKIGNDSSGADPKELQLAVKRLESYIFENIDNSYYYIVIDDLDEDYREYFKEENRQRYSYFISGLLKAVMDIRSVCGYNGPRVYPCVCIRTDIFELIEDPDKNKWTDLIIDLKWDTRSLRKLLHYRLARALDLEPEDHEPDAILGLVFHRSSLTAGAQDVEFLGKELGSRQSLIDYMISYTQWRPRDLIKFMKLCAERQLSKEPSKIQLSVAREITPVFSEYLLAEIRDEMLSVVPFIDKIFDRFRDQHRSSFEYDEFVQLLGTPHVQDESFRIDTETLVKTMYYFGIIGYRDRERVAFRYIAREFRPGRPILIHRGLRKTLNLETRNSNGELKATHNTSGA